VKLLLCPMKKKGLALSKTDNLIAVSHREDNYKHGATGVKAVQRPEPSQWERAGLADKT